MDCKECGKPMILAGIDYQKGGEKQRWKCTPCNIIFNDTEYLPRGVMNE